MSDLPDMQELVCIVSTDSMPMLYIEVDAARRLLNIAKQQQAEIERLREQLNRANNLIGESQSLCDKAITDRDECRRLLREGLAIFSASNGYCVDGQVQWRQEAAKAAGGDGE